MPHCSYTLCSAHIDLHHPARKRSDLFVPLHHLYLLRSAFASPRTRSASLSTRFAIAIAVAIATAIATATLRFQQPRHNIPHTSPIRPCSPKATLIAYGGFAIAAALLGILGVASSQRPDGKEDFKLLWGYLWMACSTVVVTLYLCFILFYAGSGVFHEAATHHWDVLRSRYPGLAAANASNTTGDTDAGKAIGAYYAGAMAVWGAVSGGVLVAAAVGAYNAGQMLTWEKVGARAPAAVNYFLLVVGSAALAFGFHMLGIRGLYADSVWPPLLFFCASWLILLAGLIGLCSNVARTRSCLHAYIVLLAVALLVLGVFCAYCISVPGRMAASFDDVPDSVFGT